VFLHPTDFVAAVIGEQGGRAEVVGVDVIYLFIDAGGNSPAAGVVVLGGRNFGEEKEDGVRCFNLSYTNYPTIYRAREYGSHLVEARDFCPCTNVRYSSDATRT
jgi:hypothetical protein